MARRIRGDIRVDSLEKKLGLLPGTIRNPKTGRDRRGDCRLRTLRAEKAKANK